MWMEFAIFFGIYSVGSILFSGFEEKTSKWKKLAKLLVFSVLIALIYLTVGRPWSYLWLAIPLLFAIYIHAIWLPRHGVNGLTGEPKSRYYELRGWKQP